MTEKPDVQNTGGKNISGKTAEPNPVPVPNSGTPVKMIDPGTLKFWPQGKELPEGLEGSVESDEPLTCRNKPIALCLSVCRACNLACRYCYVQNRPEIESMPSMGLGTAVRAIRLCDGPQKISFFGGEPLLEFDLIRDVVETVRGMKSGDDVHFHITTNGTRVEPQHADFFKAHGFSAIVSLDGPAEIHNLNRPFGFDVENSSFQKTMGGLKHLKAAGMGGRITLRSTYTKDCVRLVERLSFLNDLVDSGIGGGVAVEPISSSESSCVDPSVGRDIGIDGEAAVNLLPEYQEAFDWCLQRAEDGLKVRWHHLNHFARRLVNRSPSCSECGAAKGYISVTPNGDVYPCHREPGNPIGNVSTGISEKARAKWMDNRYYVRSSCNECWARNICGGGCRADSVVHEGDIRKPFTTNCVLNRIMIGQTIRILCELDKKHWENVL